MPVQMMRARKDPKIVIRYDHHRESLDQNAVNFLDYTLPEEPA
jgi:nanoRNase/pAp phosphatase (c-di-AMP/oligoRNAs hydrolase)